MQSLEARIEHIKRKIRKKRKKIVAINWDLLDLKYKLEVLRIQWRDKYE